MGAGAFIQSGAGLVGQIISNKANQKLANQQAQWNLDQWNRQNTRDDKLWNEQNAYNLEMWNMQNEYNSPQEQMARMKAAGINPHSLAGQGPTNAQAIETAKRKTQAVQGYNRAESKNVLAGINAFSEHQRLKNLEVQTDNVKSNTNLTDQKAVTEAIMRTLDVDKKARDNYIGREVQEYSIEAARIAVENANKDLDVKDQSLKNMRQDVTKSKAQTQALAQQILNGKSQVLVNQSMNKSRAKEQVLQDYRIGLSKLGLNEKDPYYTRVAVKVAKSQTAKEAAKEANLGLTKAAKKVSRFEKTIPKYRNKTNNNYDTYEYNMFNKF